MLLEGGVNVFTPQSYQICEDLAAERVEVGLEGDDIVGLLHDVPGGCGLARVDDLLDWSFVELRRGALELFDASGLRDDIAKEGEMLTQSLAIPALKFCDEGRRDALRSDSKMNHEGIILGLVGELELQDGQDRSSRKIEPTAGEKNQNKKGNKKKLTSRGLHLSAPA